VPIPPLNKDEFVTDERSKDERRVDRMLTAALVILFLIGPLVKLSLMPWPILVAVVGTPLVLLTIGLATHISRIEGISRRDVLARGLPGRRRRERG
jgi:archaellum biogenesis protein FlaJ (TadC family)